jgi:hypothetical protein
LAVSDDRSEKNPARFYELSLDLAKFQRSDAPGNSGVTFHSFTIIQRPGGGVFKKKSVDPEGLRFDATRNKIYWTSEGRRGLFSFDNPAVSEMHPDGSHSRSFAVPSYYFPRGSELGIFPGNTGIHNNLAFESLAISTDGATLYAATENGLIKDSPPANAFGFARAILAFDIASGRSEKSIFTRSSPLPSPNLAWTVCNQWSDRFITVGTGNSSRSSALYTRCGHPGKATGCTVRLCYADTRRHGRCGRKSIATGHCPFENLASGFVGSKTWMVGVESGKH